MIHERLKITEKHNRQSEESMTRKAGQLMECEERPRQFGEESFATLEWDLGGHITYASPAVALITGYSPQEMKGRLIKRYLTAAELAKFDKALTDKVVKGVRVKIRKKDRSLVSVEASVGHLSGAGWWLEFRQL